MTEELCTKKCCGSDHLDMTEPPKILVENCSEIEFIKEYHEYIKKKVGNVTSDHRTVDECKIHNKLYAITLTLHPKEQRACKMRNIKVEEYLYKKMITLKIGGIYVIERNKRGIKHLHGIVYGDTEIGIHTIGKHKDKFQLPKWKASNMIKRLKDNNNSRERWLEYCSKTLLSSDVIQWLKICDKDETPSDYLLEGAKGSSPFILEFDPK